MIFIIFFSIENILNNILFIILLGVFSTILINLITKTTK